MSKVTVVTGANKGIGFHVARLLAASKSSSEIVYLTARDETRGKEASDALKKQGIEVAFHQLDTTSDESVNKLATYLKNTHGGLDILVNNAGFCSPPDVTSLEEDAHVTIETNFFGTLRVSEALVPLIRDGGRVVHVSSQLGHYCYQSLSDELKAQFSTPTLTLEKLKSLVSSYVTDIRTGSQEAKGWPSGRPWPSHAYGVSKIGVTVLCFLQQRNYDAQYPGNDVIFSACCPGFCDTDMTLHRGTKTAADGADVAVFLASLPQKSDVERGMFWADRKPVPWN